MNSSHALIWMMDSVDLLATRCTHGTTAEFIHGFQWEHIL